MQIDLSFWRFVIILNFAKSLLWSRGEDTYLLHFGTFTNGKNTAIKIVILPISLMVGFINDESNRKIEFFELLALAKAIYFNLSDFSMWSDKEN